MTGKVVAHTRATPSPPLWVSGVALIAAGAEPLAHMMTVLFPPEGAAGTGLNIPDSVLFIHCMRMFRTGFLSPWATCQSFAGAQSLTFYAVFFFWLYGMVGQAAHWLRLADWAGLALANFACALFYVLAVYRFMRTACPRLANRAFLLFALGGGLGGILYMATALAGLHSHPHFEPHFFRYAFYELIEGSRLSPWLVGARLYYTLPLALGFTVLNREIRAAQSEKSPKNRDMTSLVLLFILALINFRVGAMFLIVLGLYTWTDRGRSPARTLQRLALPLAVTLIGAIASVLAATANPVLTGDMARLRTAMWLSPFISATFLFWLALPGEMRRQTNGTADRLVRSVAWAAQGYLLAFVLLFIGWHVYYGTLWRCGDYGAARVISDPALLGALAGALWGWTRPTRPLPDDSDRLEWVNLWFLVFLAVSVSGFGQGWFMRLVPERLMVLLPVPMCLLSASATRRWRPLPGRALVTAIVICGMASMAVALFWMKGPLAGPVWSGPYDHIRHDAVSRPDARCLEEPLRGTLLTPHELGDYASVLGWRVLTGNGAFTFSDRPVAEVEQLEQDFYSPETPDTTRREMTAEWCVDFVYVPNAPPIAEETAAALRQAPWLTEERREDGAVLYRVDSGQVSRP